MKLILAATERTNWMAFQKVTGRGLGADNQWCKITTGSFMRRPLLASVKRLHYREP